LFEERRVTLDLALSIRRAEPQAGNKGCKQAGHG
jgi:hypothetical protein